MGNCGYPRTICCPANQSSPTKTNKLPLVSSLIEKKNVNYDVEPNIEHIHIETSTTCPKKKIEYYLLQENQTHSVIPNTTLSLQLSQKFPCKAKKTLWDKQQSSCYSMSLPSNSLYGKSKTDYLSYGSGGYRYNDNLKYQDQLIKHPRTGKGEETWINGTYYTGEYYQGRKHGQGILRWFDNSIYIGEFYHNSLHGIGCYVWRDGRRYEGRWKMNHMHGYGRFKWADNRQYEGEYTKDKKHGYGVFTWTDQRCYIGGWLEGQQHGIAIYMTGEGVQKVGVWEHGHRLRWLSDSRQIIQALNDCDRKLTTLQYQASLLFDKNNQLKIDLSIFKKK